MRRRSFYNLHGSHFNNPSQWILIPYVSNVYSSDLKCRSLLLGEIAVLVTPATDCSLHLKSNTKASNFCPLIGKKLPQNQLLCVRFGPPPPSSRCRCFRVRESLIYVFLSTVTQIYECHTQLL